MFYVKTEDTEELLKDLVKYLRRDDPDDPFVKIKLGYWNVMEQDLIKLLIGAPQDKKLAYFLVANMVLLTEFPQDTCRRKFEMISIL